MNLEPSHRLLTARGKYYARTRRVGYGLDVDFLDRHIVGFVLLARWTGASSRGPAASQPSAEEILKRRSAEGAIGKEEYEQKPNDLRQR